MATAVSRIATKSKKKIPLPRTPRMVDTKYLGLEPEFETPLKENDIRLHHAYNWYNHFYDVKEAKQWAVEYFAPFDKELSKTLSRVPEANFSTTVGWLARIQTRGYSIPQRSKSWFNTKIEEMKKYAPPIKRKTESQEQVKCFKSNPWETIIEDFELELDKFYTNSYKSDFSPYEYLSKNDVKKTYAQSVAEYFRPLLEEIKLILRKDKELVEAYKSLTKIQITNYQKFVYSLVDDCDKWAANKTKKTVSRKPRKKSTEQILKNFKYLKDISELKVVAIDPASIIGASGLVAYNHKYRRLVIFNAIEGQKLSIKGTSLIGFDENTSQSKTLRKPAEQLKYFISGTPAYIKKTFNDIKTKPSPANGRFSLDVIPLKVIK